MSDKREIRRLLIANRGEVALRIIRSCKVRGIEVVCVYSQADREGSWLRYADDAICISERSYLEPAAMIMAAKNSDCDAIHPGYGFLAENAEFAAAVNAAGLVFVGPSAEHIALMGAKATAREQAVQLGLGVLPGTACPQDADLSVLAEQIGYPLIVKAVYGGGGRGMRIVNSASVLEGAVTLARREAGLAFGRDDLYLEKYLSAPRHIEVQVLGDGQGKALALGARDCSVQRRYQKLIEESPPPSMPADRLQPLLDLCATVIARLAYRGLGTLEFLYDGQQFFFIEMNTRLQVEHPVTESIFGVDLIGLQLEIAAGQLWSDLEAQVIPTTARGHAIEVRLLAEGQDQLPSAGTIKALTWPGGPGIRIDSHLEAGYQIPHQYDSLLAKLIAWGADREEARMRLLQALQELRIEGISTNRQDLIKLLKAPDFRTGKTSTELFGKVIP
ncbi:MAG: ATP-grasp domain-containing protein [Pseudomonadales bacterium]|nr:ATP-grasp domain-containing protein [Pseudomonadales bacterium]